MTKEQIEHTFKYHSPNPESVTKHELIRRNMTGTVVSIAELLPLSRERSLFIELMQQAQMMANAAVAIHSPEAH